MCLLIVTTKTTVLTLDDFEEYHDYNSDGFGMMFYSKDKNKQLCIVKGANLRPHEQFRLWQRYGKGKQCTLHWRMATHGVVSDENTHPFIISDGYAIAHNGILSWRSTPEKSDTAHFVDDVLKPMQKVNPSCLNNKEVLKSIGQIIGNSNKFVIGTPSGFEIVNRKHGYENARNNAWYSNTYAWDAPMTWANTYRGAGHTLSLDTPRSKTDLWNDPYKGLFDSYSYYERDANDLTDTD